MLGSLLWLWYLLFYASSITKLVQTRSAYKNMTVIRNRWKAWTFGWKSIYCLCYEVPLLCFSLGYFRLLIACIKMLDVVKNYFIILDIFHLCQVSRDTWSSSSSQQSSNNGNSVSKTCINGHCTTSVNGRCSRATNRNTGSFFSSISRSSSTLCLNGRCTTTTCINDKCTVSDNGSKNVECTRKTQCEMNEICVNRYIRKPPSPPKPQPLRHNWKRKRI